MPIIIIIIIIILCDFGGCIMSGFEGDRKQKKQNKTKQTVWG